MNKITVLLIGRTGSGKSALANVISNDKKFPMTWRGFTLLLIIFGGFALLVWFIAYKRKKS